MKTFLISLLSLTILNSYGQDLAALPAAFVPARFDVAAEITRAGRAAMAAHSKADTCLTTAQIRQGKTYVDWLERALQKAQANVTLLKFQADQRGEEVTAVESENVRLRANVGDLTGKVTECEEKRERGRFWGRIGTGLAFGAGAVLGVLIAK